MKHVTIRADSFATQIGSTPSGTAPPKSSTSVSTRDAWGFYDTIGEAHYAANYIGRAMSSARLFVSETVEEGQAQEVTAGRPREVSNSLLGGMSQARTILHQYGVQKKVAGQSLLTVSDEDGWSIFPDRNFSVRRLGNQIVYDVQNRIFPSGTLFIHVWTPHPGDMNDIDSSFRAALPILHEIKRYTSYISTTLDSRITLAGLLQIPQGANYPQLSDKPVEAHPFMYLLQKAMEAGIADENSAAARVPISVEVPPGEEVKHLSMEYPLTESASEKRFDAIKRLGMSMDIPPEVLTGMAETNRSTSWQIDESTVKNHVRPALFDLTDALTKHYVQPLLEDDRYFVDFDLSELQIRPDRSESAIALYDRQEIDGSALREETGLSDYEAPENQDLLNQLLRAAIRSNPALITELAPLLQQSSIDIPSERIEIPNPSNQIPESGITETREPDVERPVGASIDGLVAACDVLVLGALKSAGLRWVRAKSSRHKDWKHVNPTTIYLKENITSDAMKPGENEYDRAHRYVGMLSDASLVAARHSANDECLKESLREYIVSLLVRQRAHRPSALIPILQECANAA